MKILAINGSGRAGGNTFALLSALLEGAASAGHETQMIELAGMNINPCSSCRACKVASAGGCVQSDDMERFYSIAKDVDYLALGSPVYLDSEAANMTLFQQRLYCYLDAKVQGHYPNPNAKVITAITYGLPYPDRYKHVTDHMSLVMEKYFKLEVVAQLAAHGMLSDRIIQLDNPVMTEAYELGASLR